MKVKEAVKIAISYVTDLFEDENPSNIGLEEVVYNSDDNTWDVTIGMSRPWDYQRSPIAAALQQTGPKRKYKVVKVSDEDGAVLSVKIRELDGQKSFA
jgi:hypothetical protein